MSRWLAIAFVLTGAGCYGFVSVLAKLGYTRGLQVGHVNAGQFAAGTLLLWGIAACLGSKGAYKRVTRNAVLKLMAAGTLMGLTGSLLNAAIKLVPASIAIVLLFQFVWIGVLYDGLFRRVKPDGRSLLAIAITILGASFAANVWGGQFMKLSALGVALGLCSAFSYAGTLYVSGRVETEVSPWLRGSLMASGALILVLCVYPPTYLASPDVPWGWFTLFGIVLGLIGVAVPTVCFNLGAPSLSVGLTSMLGSIELPVAVLMARVVLSEPVSLLQVSGICLILGGIAAKGARIGRRRRTLSEQTGARSLGQ
ncbi:DMT family transporter [Cohnella sp. REN36]|uniref:DMT family transporter n=1 Tax=Cohnella sp. REN36 TaxID=2887347 RepID=UPI001D14F8A1|nr:DMT family transporter [Cohnella sp. REN36]MCC3375312.1 DMT family transporter [Cohnella sp. REN36]